MILFQLKCGQDHSFEAWFRNGAAFENHAPGSITCPICGNTDIAKGPMAPRIKRASGATEAAEDTSATVARKLAEIQRQIEEHCDYVGDRFAEEARRIHYGEVAPHDIYGEATAAQSRELREEGVEFLPVPWQRRTN